jgi:hypothetical protein
MDATVHHLNPPQTAPEPEVSVHRFRRALKRALHEPFFQFLLLGALIWGAAEYVEAQSQRYTINIGPAERQRLAIAYQQQYNQAPTPEQLQALTDRYVRQQIFVREGHALGLDKGDEIVERRIAQKFEFIQQDLGAPDTPDDATLRRWYDRHRLQYLSGPRVTLSQIYFSPDRDGETGAKARAERALARLNGGKITRAPGLGDAFPGPTDLGTLGHDDAVRLFGDSALTNALTNLPVGHWSGPLRSGYGWHLVYVSHRLPPDIPAFEKISSRVADDYREEQRRIVNAQEFEKLRSKYRVEYRGDR